MYGDDDHLRATFIGLKLPGRQLVRRGFPREYDLIRRRWSPAYPETTGYTIPTLLNLVILKRPDAAEMALRLAEYLLKASRQMERLFTGRQGEAHNRLFLIRVRYCFGCWRSTFSIQGMPGTLGAGVRAGNWLVSVQSSSGSWMQYQHLGTEKVIDTRVSTGFAIVGPTGGWEFQVSSC